MGDFSFPDSFESFLVKKSPIETALYFQLLGIAISEEQRLHQRTRYFERSLTALRHVSESVPALKILKARALFYLYRRPEAVVLLSSPNTPEEKAFLSFLNGNYYDLENQLQNVEPGVLHAMSYIELTRLADLYQLPKVMHNLEWVDGPWRTFILHASSTRDRWNTPSNFGFFNSLAGLHSKFDNAYQDVVAEKYVIDQVQGDYSSGDMLFAKTITKLLKIGSPNNCCNYNESEISELDILNYYRTLGGAVYRVLEFLRSNNLAHKLETANKFVACTYIDCDHQHPASQFLICKRCLKVKELSMSQPKYKELKHTIEQAGYHLNSPQLEMNCICKACYADAN